MIGLIATIWGTLDDQQRIIVFICTLLVLVGVGLYIYGRMKKVLYAIPPLLYQMRCRCMELARNLRIDADDHIKSLALLTNDSPENFISKLVSNVNVKEGNASDIDIVKSVLKDAIDSIRTQMNTEVTSDPATIDRVVEYYGKASGLDELLCKDKQYSILNKKLEKLRTVIPTEEISLCVNRYLREVKAFSSMLPAQYISKGTAEMLPLRHVMDLAIWPSNIENELSKSLAKVREAIDKYYRMN